MPETLGRRLAAAVAAKDEVALRGLLQPDVDFRALTPGRVWEAEGPDDIVAAVQAWFDDGDHIEGTELVESDRFADRERVGYRLRVRNTQGLHLVEQQAYLTERDGRIGWLRMMCSGYRPVG